MQFVGNQARKAAFIPRCFGIFTLFLLAGYALFGRGFAYLGVPPVFVGEIGLLLAVAALLSGIHRPLWQSSVWLLVAFVLWGASCTFPYVSEYGLDALRDGVIWGYAIYSLAVASVVLRLNAIDKIVLWYRSALPLMGELPAGTLVPDQGVPPYRGRGKLLGFPLYATLTSQRQAGSVVRFASAINPPEFLTPIR